jgi:hypothetical protein
MAYSDFSLDQVIDNFGLHYDRANLFSSVEPVPVSDWLKDFLDRGLNLGLASGTEKARSEFIIAPILFDLARQYPEQFTIFSGKTLESDPDRGLLGECDFILSQGKLTEVIQAPIFTVVEAKKQDMEKGLGQCAAQLVGAQYFNQHKHSSIDAVFGCVTTGENWRFLQLKDQDLQLDSQVYYIVQLEKILGILQSILRIFI